MCSYMDKLSNKLLPHRGKVANYEKINDSGIFYYTIIDFNEVDIRIYLPEKVIIHRGR